VCWTRPSPDPLSAPSGATASHSGYWGGDVEDPRSPCRSTYCFQYSGTRQREGICHAADACQNIFTKVSPSSRILASLLGLPRLMIWPSHFPSFVFNDVEEALNPVTDIREAAFLLPPINQQNRLPSTRFRISWVMARELPILAEVRLSNRGPIQLKGRNRVNFSSSF